MRESSFSIDYDLIDRYLSGELCGEALSAFRKQLEADTELRQRVEFLQNTMAEMVSVQAPYDFEEAVQKIQSVSSKARVEGNHSAKRVAAQVSAANAYKGTGSSRRFTWSVATSFAAMALLLIAGFSLISGDDSTASSQMSTYETGMGERATIRLPDGSSVLLSVASRIHVPTDYSENNRNIILDGQALFTVVNNEGAPFTVRAGPSFTKVLGTRFSVRHYNTDSVATVAVESGKVAVGSSVITANEGVAVNSSGESSLISVTQNHFSFADGILEFRYKGLREAIPELNRWYNADIKLGDESLAGSKVVGAFEAGSITDLMSILELLFDVRIVRDGRTLTLYGRG